MDAVEKLKIEFQLPSDVPGYAKIKPIFDQQQAYCLKDFFNLNQIAQIVKAFYSAEEDWVAGFREEENNFKGSQFSLGEAWYFYPEGNMPTNEYFKNALTSRDIVEKHIPGLQGYVLDYLRKFYETDNVNLRKGWAGPGIMNFPAHNWVSENGGVPHFDAEGLPGIDLSDSSVETHSYVAMLEKPEKGGDLLVWDVPYNPADQSHCDNDLDKDLLPDEDAFRIKYRLKDLWMFNGMRPHMIQPFEGNKDRICLTFHTLKRGNSWECWF